MTLAIYTGTSPGTIIDATNPLQLSFDGRTGGATEKILYVRNDDVTRAYTTITVQTVDTIAGNTNFVDGTDGSWKLSDGATQPTAEQWVNISAANQISIADIGDAETGDTTTYSPFWIRVSVPANTAVTNITDVRLRINATELEIA